MHVISCSPSSDWNIIEPKTGSWVHPNDWSFPPLRTTKGVAQPQSMYPVNVHAPITGRTRAIPANIDIKVVMDDARCTVLGILGITLLLIPCLVPIDEYSTPSWDDNYYLRRRALFLFARFFPLFQQSRRSLSIHVQHIGFRPIAFQQLHCLLSTPSCRVVQRRPARE